MFIEIKDVIVNFSNVDGFKKDQKNQIKIVFSGVKTEYSSNAQIFTFDSEEERDEYFEKIKKILMERRCLNECL